MSLSTNLDQAANAARDLERRNASLTMCAGWLLDALNHAESLADSEIERHMRQLTEALGRK